MTDQKLYIVTMQSGPDLFKELVFGLDMDEAKTIAELRHNCKCVNVRRAACHPGREVEMAVLAAEETYRFEEEVNEVTDAMEARGGPLLVPLPFITWDDIKF